MVILVRKILRDIWKNKVQFSAIFIMLFLGVFIFAGISSEWYGLSFYSQQYLQESHFPSAIIYIEKSNTKDKQALLQNENIKEVETRTIIDTTLSKNTKKEITLHVMESNEIAKLHVVSGVEFSNHIDGIWLDAMFAKENAYQIGDLISLEKQGLKIEKKIVGLVYSPEYIYGVQDGKMVPDHVYYGFAFMGTGHFPYANALLNNQIVVQSSGKHIKEEIEKTLQGKKSTVMVKQNHPSYAMINEEIAQHQSMGTIFSLAFLIIAVLITITTMHRMLQSQRIQVGILKALGFTNRKLLVHFICHSSLICLLAATLGYVSGTLILPNIIYPMMKEMYVLPVLQSQFLPYGWFLPIGCFMSCLIISAFICRRYTKEKAASILQGNRASTNTFVFPYLFRHLPFRYQWNIRDILRNRLRSIMTILGVIGCTALLFCSFGLYDTMTRISSFAFDDLQQYACKIMVNPSQLTSLQTIKAAMNGQEIMERSITIQYHGQQKEGTITVVEDTNLVRIATSLDTYTTLDDGVALSYTIARKWGIEVGDTITYRLYAGDAWQEEIVTSIIRTPINQGIVILKKEYLASKKEYIPTALVGDIPHLLDNQNELVQSMLEKDDLKQSMNAMLEGVVMMIVILVIGAVILGGVVLYNLGVLSYLERYRELATLKVLGFQDKDVKKLLIQQNVWLASIGIVFGLVAGYGLLVYMMTTLSESMDVVLMVKPISIGYACVGTLLLSWLISFFLSRKTRHIDMVSALKSNE